MYQVQPRIDTKQVAYQLLETFGDLSQVMKADYDSLMKVKGIGQTSAEYLNELWKLYIAYSDYSIENFCLRSVESRQVYFMKQLARMGHDTMMLACLNDRMRVIECKGGNQFFQRFPKQDLLDMIRVLIPVHCSQIVIAMSRSNGITGFCREEIQFAENLRKYFQPLKIKISDVILIVNGHAFSLESETR